MGWNSDTSWNAEKDLSTVNIDVKNQKNNLDDAFINLHKNKTYDIIKEVSEISFPKKGEQKRIVTFNHFNHIVFLYLIAKKYQIEELLLVVFSMNYEAAKVVNEISKKAKTTILMSNIRNKAHRKKEQLTRDMFVDNPNVDLFFAQSHSKVTSVKTKCGEYFTIEGSGNHTKTSRIEQYVLDNDKDLFNFTKDWMREIKNYLKDKRELVIT